MCNIICNEIIVLYIYVVCINNLMGICNKELDKIINNRMGELRGLIVVFYVVGEGEKDDIEEFFIFILEEGGIDL